MSPGMTVRPRRSITRVDGPANSRTSSVDPVAVIRPAVTASPIATVERESSVMILPLIRIVSGACAEAGTAMLTTRASRQSARMPANCNWVAGWLEAFPQLLLQLVSIAATERQARAVAQDDDVFAVEPGLQFLDALGVDDARAMNANEALRIQARFHTIHRLAEEMRFLAQMEAHVVAGRLDPIQIAGAQEEHTT